MVSGVSWAEGHLAPTCISCRTRVPPTGVWDSCFSRIWARRREPSRRRLGQGQAMPLPREVLVGDKIQGTVGIWLLEFSLLVGRAVCVQGVIKQEVKAEVSFAWGFSLASEVQPWL